MKAAGPITAVIAQARSAVRRVAGSSGRQIPCRPAAARSPASNGAQVPCTSTVHASATASNGAPPVSSSRARMSASTWRS